MYLAAARDKSFSTMEELKDFYRTEAGTAAHGGVLPCCLTEEVQ